jgi:hypothetical protein
MTDRKLMQMVMDALESSRVFVMSREKIKHPEGTEWYDERIKALRARLAQPEPEPVVWMYQDKSTHEVRFQKHMRPYVDHGATYEVPLYTTPPQREWRSLTDDEIDEVFGSPMKLEPSFMLSFVRAIEAKLKEKNNG